MIDYGVFRYAGPPRTGSTWVLKAAALAGLGEGQKAKLHEPHSPGASLKVSTVRHPVDWLKSYWAEIHGGCVGVPAVDWFAVHARSSEDFPEFVERYLAEQPGAVSRMFLSYGADSWIRTDELAWGFCDLLESAGVPRKQRELVLALPRQCCARRPLPDLPDPLRRRVLEAERRIVEEFEFF